MKKALLEALKNNAPAKFSFGGPVTPSNDILDLMDMKLDCFFEE